MCQSKAVLVLGGAVGVAHKAIAALSATAHHDHVGTVACSLVLPTNNSELDTRVQLLPDGLFKATDGRPFDVPSGQWLMDERAWQSLQQHAAARTNDYVTDYEHQTLRTEENGQPAPAAGWFKPSALGYEPGFGLFASSVEWTAKARAYITAKEYRFISAVFAYDKATGRVQELLHIALTNNPALDGLKAIAALTKDFSTTPTKENTMNQAQRLLAALGVSIEGVDLNDAAAVEGLIDKGVAACTALKAKEEELNALAASVTTLTSEVAALTSQQGKFDSSKFVPIAVHTELQTAYAALSKQSGDTAIADLLEAEKAKIYGPADREYLQSIGKERGVAALTKMLNERSPIAALTATQTTTTDDPAKLGVVALTADEKLVADQLGISHADFAKAKENK
ncbi:phage protease [Shewanella avicenniae]|uniref:Phage protease n=1 Tax=Shewanella avicenniae TaxID=2814294 RepID=A0ABX7QPG6_9GAMM|nr:phage protease [Shewanella avicenniae]QSX32618.1 phage protease [Shewanella avicenniae]